MRDGKRLCALVNTIKPGAVKKVYEGNIAFKVMENLSKFNAAIRDLGVPTDDLFTPPDLYEGKDLGGVVRTLQSLGRVAQGVEGFDGPHLGAKLATETKRTFDDLKEDDRRQAKEHRHLDDAHRGQRARDDSASACRRRRI